MYCTIYNYETSETYEIVDCGVVCILPHIVDYGNKKYGRKAHGKKNLRYNFMDIPVATIRE